MKRKQIGQISMTDEIIVDLFAGGRGRCTGQSTGVVRRENHNDGRTAAARCRIRRHKHER